MELRYPIVIIIGIIITSALFYFFGFKKIKYLKGKRIANTNYLKDSDLYKKKLKKYKNMILAFQIVCALSILISIFIIARFYSEKSTKNESFNRDIVLCMDVSFSVNKLNNEVVEALKSVVDNLRGERFSISMFNTSTVLMSPLTSDYNYTLGRLDKLNETLLEINKICDENGFCTYSSDYDERQLQMYYYKFITDKTLEGVEYKGASLTGEGLASCMNSFNSLKDTERTKIVIFTTDNAQHSKSKENITLEAAEEIAKKYKVHVYSVATETMDDYFTSNSDPIGELKRLSKNTNGKFYRQGEVSTKEIISDIEKTSKSKLVNGEITTKLDNPLVPFILLIISTLLLIFLSKGVKE